MIHRKRGSIALAATLLVLTARVWAAEYTPDLIEFSGTETLNIKTGTELSFAAGGTVEFWVAPDWQGSLGYAPVIVACKASEQLIFAVAMSEQKDQLFLYAGSRSAALSYDFADGDMHHVAIASLDDIVNVLIDGTFVAGLDFVFPPEPAEHLSVGGLAADTAPFKGALAQLRVWDTALVPEELADFAMANEQANDEPHPSLSALRVRSDFANQQLILIPFSPVPVSLDLDD